MKPASIPGWLIASVGLSAGISSWVFARAGGGGPDPAASIDARVREAFQRACAPSEVQDRRAQVRLSGVEQTLEKQGVRCQALRSGIAALEQEIAGKLLAAEAAKARSRSGEPQGGADKEGAAKGAAGIAYEQVLAARDGFLSQLRDSKDLSSEAGLLLEPHFQRMAQAGLDVEARDAIRKVMEEDTQQFLRKFQEALQEGRGLDGAEVVKIAGDSYAKSDERLRALLSADQYAAYAKAEKAQRAQELDLVGFAFPSRSGPKQ